MGMTRVSASSVRIAEHQKGPVVAVAFAGSYLPGSGGNEFAHDMVTHVSAMLDTTNAVAVLFDLRNLEYESGDAICGLVWPLREGASHFRPSAIVATGGTARALEPLLGPNWLFGIAGTKMFGAMPEAVAHLEKMLGGKAG
jgi:hypothetical protein